MRMGEQHVLFLAKRGGGNSGLGEGGVGTCCSGLGEEGVGVPDVWRGLRSAVAMGQARDLRKGRAGVCAKGFARAMTALRRGSPARRHTPPAPPPSGARGTWRERPARRHEALSASEATGGCAGRPGAARAGFGRGHGSAPSPILHHVSTHSSVAQPQWAHLSARGPISVSHSASSSASS
jgi:hypothetical protein